MKNDSWNTTQLFINAMSHEVELAILSPRQPTCKSPVGCVHTAEWHKIPRDQDNRCFRSQNVSPWKKKSHLQEDCLTTDVTDYHGWEKECFGFIPIRATKRNNFSRLRECLTTDVTDYHGWEKECSGFIPIRVIRVIRG